MKQPNATIWPQNWTDQIGRAIARRRKIQGLSAARLSELCSELGFPIARNTITNLENGRKESVPVHELVVLATALEAAPIDLLFPAAMDETVPFVRRDQDAVTTAVWFQGGVGSAGDSELSLYVRHLLVVQQIEMWDKPGGRAREGQRNAVSELRNLRRLLTAGGLRLPELPPRVEELLASEVPMGGVTSG